MGKKKRGQFIVVGTIPLSSLNDLGDPPKEIILNEEIWFIEKSKSFKHLNKPCAACKGVGTIIRLSRYQNDDPLCAVQAHLCLIRPNGKLYVMTDDHIIARADGGSNYKRNIQTMCMDCNARKSSDKSNRFSSCVSHYKHLKNMQDQARRLAVKDADKFDELNDIIETYHNELKDFVARYKSQ